MPKTYNIEEVIGNNQFTYQLYINIKPTIEGSNDLAVVLEASEPVVGVFYASATVSGQTTPPAEDIYQIFLHLDPGTGNQSGFGLESTGSDFFPDFTYAFVPSSGTIATSNTAYNGEVVIRWDEPNQLFYYYLNDVLLVIGSAANTIGFATSSSVDSSNAGGMTITNIVLGT